MSKEAMKLALDALTQWQYSCPQWWDEKDDRAITALREALAQQALDKKAENARELGLDYEPVQDGGIVTAGGFDPRTRRTWVGLTDEEANKIYKDGSTFGEMMRMVEAKLKEKNT